MKVAAAILPWQLKWINDSLIVGLDEANYQVKLYQVAADTCRHNADWDSRAIAGLQLEVSELRETNYALREASSSYSKVIDRQTSKIAWLRFGNYAIGIGAGVGGYFIGKEIARIK